MTQEPAHQFGLYIRQLREERNLSIRGLAGRAGISHGIVSRLESGQRMPGPETLKALADALQVPLADLFAAAGYVVHDLPSLKPYMRARYGQLPEEVITALDSYLKRLIDQYDLEPYGPLALEDETAPPERTDQPNQPSPDDTNQLSSPR